MRLLRPLFAALDAIKAPRMLELVWRLLVRTSRLTGAEITTAASVLGQNSIRYEAVRIANGGVLGFAFKLNGGRAFTLFHTLNLPGSGNHSRENLSLLVHELVHVYQFETVGIRYIPEALLAQRREGYDYGSWQALVEARGRGEGLDTFNREQQAQIAQDYYRWVVEPQREDAVRDAYEPYIEDLRRGAL